MAVFRVEKSKNYTTISNYCLRDTRLSLKAKGLLAQMLSLPEDWDYTLLGLAQINKEGKDSIRAALAELEDAGYVVRTRARDEHGRLRGADYVVFETPQNEEITAECPEEVPAPMSENPTQEAPMSENPTLENTTQLNKDILSTDKERKINKKKERPPKEEFDPMEQIKAWIGYQFNPAAAYDKNRLYFAFKGFVENRVALKKPLKTKGAVTALCNRLGRLTCTGDNQIQWMIELLEDATSNNWQTVYVRGSQPQPQADVPEGRHYDVI